MSGIAGYLGPRPAAEVLVGALRRLERQGCDSVGLATVAGGRCEVRKTLGRVDHLERLLAETPAAGGIGIAHTRWATHGRPSTANAHPHLDAAERIALVHNGVVENHASVRRFLEGQGVAFRSETDTESLAQLIGFFYQQTGDLLQSLRGALREVQGTFGLALVCRDSPDTLLVARRGSPMSVAAGPDDLLVASDPAAFVGRAGHVTHLEDDEVALLGPEGVKVATIDARAVPTRSVPFEPAAAEPLGGFAHHMAKEIFEQPEALRNTMRGRLRPGADRVTLGGLKGFVRELPRLRRALLFGCGTSWHAALIGRHLLEEIAGLPADADHASELRYRNPIVEEGTLAVALSQSGETADTLAALAEVRSRGALGFGVVNSVGSPVAREADAGVYLHAGPEIGIASTKSFTAQVAALAMLAMELGRRRHLAPERSAELADELAAVPAKVEAVLRLDAEVARIARRLADRPNWLYLGRGPNFPVALEGALKLKEVGYLHAEGMPAAEMKHGPIAMIDRGMPVVVIAPRDRTHSKVVANIEEARGRGGFVIALATDGDSRIAAAADEALFLPPTPALLSPLVTAVPLQLLAYHLAVVRGIDVDKPRSLAKSVTED